MLTPQDIQDVKFDRSMKGYDKEQVEEFLDTVQSDYTVLYKENATLKGKMRVLVDKIEEYRAVDEQMRKAFYNAQVTAQETIAKAQAEAEQILRNARTQADDRVNDLKAQIVLEEQRLEMAKAECRKYAAMMKAMLEDNIR
ncbi:MAG: DivIVA domain-containing protein, partial [Clostridia bacterium]|nr:DivIVA domain-containing protein [Clostridia bacterium]